MILSNRMPSSGSDRIEAFSRGPNHYGTPWSTEDPEPEILALSYYPKHVTDVLHPISDEVIALNSGPDHHTLECTIYVSIWLGTYIDIHLYCSHIVVFLCARLLPICIFESLHVS